MTADASTPSGLDVVVASHLTQAELAERWQVSERTLDRWRAEGKGPAWLKLNGRVRYRVPDVDAFEQSRLRQP
jgi:predicted site-specific integrase-resolvase